jgi:glycosyltransferase involved in cell wall biosynthesis
MTVETADVLSRVSLVVITLNEEDTIARCLASAAGVGEIIVVDSFSADRTVELAERAGAVVHRRAFVSAAEQKNWAMDRATGEWILILDADEELTPRLREEIVRELAAPRADGYRLKRRNYFFGTRIRYCGWQRDRVLRLFRRGKGRYPEVAVHEKLSLDGSSADLDSFLDHYPYRDLADYIDRMKSYGLRGALELHRRGEPWFPAIVTHPIGRFVRMYLLQGGFLDGGAGLLLCTLASVSVFFKYARLRELSSSGCGGRSR